MEVSVVLTLPAFMLGLAVWLLYESLCVSHALHHSGGGPHTKQNPGQVLEELPHHPLILTFPGCELWSVTVPDKGRVLDVQESQGEGVMSQGGGWGGGGHMILLACEPSTQEG